MWDKKKKILFVCIHNTARSQMCEAFLNKMAGDRYKAESAGLEPGKLNSLVVKVMNEIGIDISHNKTKSVFELFKQGNLYDYVITVCDQKAAERCPVFPGITQRLHWSFEDPAKVSGTEEEKLIEVRKIRDTIKATILGSFGND